MVRLKHDSGNQEKMNGMNGFAEDGEGNHDCHVLYQDSGQSSQENPMAAALDSHHNGSMENPRTEVPEPNGTSILGPNIFQGEWPMHRALWMSGPSSIGEKDPLDGFAGDDTESIMSFSSSTATMSARRSHSHQLGTKVEMVYSLLSMLGSCNKEDMSRTLLEMSNNQDSCIAMRQSGCLPLLIQLLHGSEREQLLSERSSENVKLAVREARRRASQALHNIVHAHPDDRRGRREARVLRLLEQIRDYSDYLRDLDSDRADLSHNENLGLYPGPAIAALMKLSFDEEHRHAMCQLGGLQAIAELIRADHEIHENTSDQFCVTVRRYAGMALTNLTFGDGTNKALLCSMKPFMQALVSQLNSPNEDLRQVTASVLRNLSWRADASSKQILREVGVVGILTKAAMEACKESTLKSILSALWNLSAHCSMNKADVCAIDGALEFLVSTLTYKSASKTLSIVENGGGILRNISSHIAVREDYRAVLRKQRCLQTLLSHLKSPSLTIVSNACGTLWNLSARCPQDQEALWDMGAVGMLRNLVHSKHKMISMGSSAALKNLLAARPSGMVMGLSQFLENGHAVNGGTSNMPSLLVRKQRALEADIDQNLAETCDNIDSPKTSPVPYSDITKKFVFESNGLSCIEQKPQYLSYLPGRMYHSINGQVGSPVHVPRSESKDSLGSTRSEPPHYKAQRERFRIFINNNKPATLDSRIVQEKPVDWKEKTNLQLEDNSNIVLQLFRQIQNGVNAAAEGAAPPVEVTTSEKPPIRPTSLPPPKRGVWNVRGNNLSQNGLPFSVQENGVTHSEVDRHSLDVADDGEVTQDASMSDSSHLLDISGNKRPFEREKIHTSIASKVGYEELKYYNSSTKRNSIELNDEQCNDSFSREGSFHSNEQSELMKRNVVLRKKKHYDLLTSSLAFPKETSSEDNSVDQTPLIASRCSSLSSLTSCFQHSARSSWVSDVSQRTSIIISPTDLPDSPEGATSEGKPHLFEFTDKVPDSSTHGLVRPRPAWPSSISSLPSSDSLPSSMKRLSCESDVFLNSEFTHLSSITDPSGISGASKAPMSLRTPPARPQNTPESPEKDLCSSTESSNGQDRQEAIKHESDSKDHDLVATCVELGTSNHIEDSFHNNPKLRTKLNNLSSSLSYSRSGIPVKTNNVRLTQSVTNVSQPNYTSASTEALNITSKGLSKLSVTQGDSNSCDVVRSAVCDNNDNLLFNTPHAELRLQLSSSKSRPHSNMHNFSSFLSKPVSSVTRKVEWTSQDSDPLCVLETSRSHASNERCEQEFAQHFSNGEDRSSVDSMATVISSRTYAMDERDSFSFNRMTESTKSKIKTSIPQIIRTANPVFDSEQHPRQLHIMSQHLPIYVGTSSDANTQLEKHHIPGASNSAEENATTDALSSSSPSPRDESESNGSDDDDPQLCLAYSKSSTTQLRGNRPKSRRNKTNRRSTEIRTSSDHSSEDDNKNAAYQGLETVFMSQAGHVLSIQSSDCEEKGKEDERSKEKSTESLSRGTIPDLLEGAAFYETANGELVFDMRHPSCSVRANMVHGSMTDSVELRRGALMIAADLEEGLDDCTHSSTSYDLENMKPPSCMGEMSMTSSGLSDLISNGNGCCINGKSAVDRRRNIKRSKKLNGSQRFVLKSVRQAIGNSLGIPKPVESIERPIASSDSVENLSMKSSGTSDLIENINPPSFLDDISMTNSCASLNSISSDILESRSQSLGDARSNSEMYQRLNAAAAMVQVYSRELSNIMTGSMKSSCNSDCLDLVKPPSIFQDIAEVTVEDGTEVVSDPLVSDSEPEELPHDDEASIPSINTVYSHRLQERTKTCEDEGSTENLNSSIDGDSLSIVDRKAHTAKRMSNLVFEPQSKNVDDDRESFGLGNNSFLDEDADSGLPDSLADSEKMEQLTPPPVRRGPRIVKPINRETVRQMQEKKNAEKVVKSIRGNTTANKPRNLLQQITNARYSALNKTLTGKTPTIVGSVRPTRTSALRASQNKQANIKANSGRVSPRSFLSKPPPISRSSSKIVRQVTTSSNATPTIPAAKSPCDETEVKRPDPPVKQGTFTKEDSSQKVPEISSGSLNAKSRQRFHFDDDKNNNDNVPAVRSFSSESKVVGKRLSFSTAPVVELSAANRNPLRKFSDQQRRIGETSTPASSLSFSRQDKEEKKAQDKRSPSSYSVTGKAPSASGSHTTSMNSLSSVSSSGLSGKKANPQKEVSSKISCIWKRSESSSSSANSPNTDSSSAEKNSFSGSKNRLSPKSSTLRPNSITPPNPSAGNIHRSSTYEKIARSGTNNPSTRPGVKAARPTSAVITGRTRQPTVTFNRGSPKPKPPSTTAVIAPRPTGGARIVKPVTPRPKSTAITSRTLRQAATERKSPEFKSRTLMTSAAPTCFFIGRDVNSSSTPSDGRASIPLVTAPFVPRRYSQEVVVSGEQSQEAAVQLLPGERNQEVAIQEAAKRIGYAEHIEDEDSDESHKELEL